MPDEPHRTGRLPPATALPTAAAAWSSDEEITLKGAKACEVLTSTQLTTYGVRKVAQDSTQDALTGYFSGCVWQSAGYPFHSLDHPGGGLAAAAIGVGGRVALTTEAARPNRQKNTNVRMM